MDCLDGILRAQEVGFTRGGRAAAHVDAGGGTLGRYDDRAARARLEVGGVAKAKALDRGDGQGCELG